MKSAIKPIIERLPYEVNIGCCMAPYSYNRKDWRIQISDYLKEPDSNLIIIINSPRRGSQPSWSFHWTPTLNMPDVKCTTCEKLLIPVSDYSLIQAIYKLGGLGSVESYFINKWG